MNLHKDYFDMCFKVVGVNVKVIDIFKYSNGQLSQWVLRNASEKKHNTVTVMSACTQVLHCHRNEDHKAIVTIFLISVTLS